VLSRLAPASVEVFSQELTLTIHGTGFAPGAVAHWNGGPRATTVISDTEVRIELTRVDLHAEAVRSVYVVNPGGIGGYASGPLQFTIVAGQPQRVEHRLKGLEHRRWPTTPIGGTLWTDPDGTVHEAIRYVTGGTMTITYQAGRVSRWELRLQVETHVADRHDAVHSTSIIDGGVLMYDLLNTGDRMFESAFSHVTWRSRTLGVDRFVLLHRIGGVDLPWLFEL
jgi:hypothetical protein